MLSALPTLTQLRRGLDSHLAIRVCALNHQEAQDTSAGFWEVTCPFQQPTRPWALPPTQVPPIRTESFSQQPVMSGDQARLQRACWVPGLGGRARLVPFYRWENGGSARSNFFAKIKQAEFSLTLELDLHPSTSPHERLDTFSRKSSVISEGSTLTVLTSDQLGSTRATRLKRLPRSMSCWGQQPLLAPSPPLPLKPSPVTIVVISIAPSIKCREIVNVSFTSPHAYPRNGIPGVVQGIS